MSENNPTPQTPNRYLRIPKGFRYAVLIAIGAQIVQPFFNGGLAFGPGQWNSGDDPVYADLILFVYGLLMLGAVVVMRKWPRTGIVTIGVVELMLIVQSTQRVDGSHASPTPFMLISTAEVTGCLVMAWFSRAGMKQASGGAAQYDNPNVLVK